MARTHPLAVLAAAAALAGAASMTQAQCPPTRIVSPDGLDAREFGGPLAMSPSDEGYRVAISQIGSVWAFDLVDGELVGGQEITAPFPVFSDGFGIGVDVQGDRMAIGAFQVRWPDRYWRNGSAAVYDRVEGRWVHTGTLRPPADVEAVAASAWPVINGDTIIAGGASGSPVIVYRQAPGTADGWTPVQTIEQPDGMSDGDQFGYPVVARDEWLFVGAHRELFPGFGIAGSILVYRLGIDGTYEQVQKIEGPTLGAYTIWLFGRSLDFNGTTLAAGARNASPGFPYQGAIYLFEFDGTSWALRQTLTHSGAEDGDGLSGTALRMDGDRLVAQALKSGDDRSDHTAFAFERTDTGAWRQSARLLPIPLDHASAYGRDMAMSGNLVIVGSREECDAPHLPNTGAAYLFDLSCYECPDLDADDRLTVFDFLEFMRAFEAGEAIADFDNDGTLTVADFLAFQGAFAVGCP